MYIIADFDICTVNALCYLFNRKDLFSISMIELKTRSYFGYGILMMYMIHYFISRLL